MVRGIALVAALSTRAQAAPLPNLAPAAPGVSLEAAADYVRVDDAPDITLMAFDFHAQYVAASGAGGYASLPFAFVKTIGDGGVGIGNAELGGLFVARRPRATLRLAGGLALDTTDDKDIFLHVAGQLLPRLVDAFPSAGMGTTWGRVHASVTSRVARVELGGALGIDVPFGDQVGSDADAIVNAAASAGVASGRVGAALGVAVVQRVGGDGEGIANAHVAAHVAPTRCTAIIATLAINLERGAASTNVDGYALGLAVRYAPGSVPR